MVDDMEFEKYLYEISGFNTDRLRTRKGLREL